MRFLDYSLAEPEPEDLIQTRESGLCARPALPCRKVDAWLPRLPPNGGATIRSQEVALEERDGDPRGPTASPLHRNLKQTWDPG